MYSISKIIQTADCDVLLSWAEKEKADLSFKRLSEERLTTKYATTSVKVDTVLQGVLVELSAIETIIEVLPDGPTKDDEIKKRVKLEYKKFLLETRKESYGAVALLEKQLDLARLNQEIAEVDVFIGVVKAHQLTL
jgi:hypothetical protein